MNVTKTTFVIPERYDVMCGRGRVAFKHAGNCRLRATIGIHLEEYNSCGRSRNGKTQIIRSIIQSIKMSGGRFLKFDVKEDQWYDGGATAAKNRVGSAFRDASVPFKVKCMEVMKSQLTKIMTYPQQRRPSIIVSFHSNEVQSLTIQRKWSSRESLSTVQSSSTDQAAITKQRRQVSPVNLPPLIIASMDVSFFEPTPIDSDGEEEIGTENMQSLLQALDCDRIDYDSDNETCCSEMLDEIDDSIELLLGEAIELTVVM
jgi:hypothetical protein